MRRILRFLGYGVAVLGLVFALLAAWGTWFLDLNDYKDRLQAVIAPATGLEVEFLGPIEHHVLDGLHVKLDELIIRAGGETVAVVERLQLQLSLVALLDREVILKRLEAKVRQLDLVRYRAGGVNLLPGATSGATSAGGAAISKVSIEELTLELVRARYRDAIDRRDWVFEDLSVRLAPVTILSRSEVVIDDPTLLMAYRSQGEVRAGLAQLGDLHLRDLAIAFESEEGTLRFQHLKLHILRGEPERVGSIALHVKGESTLRIGFDEPLEQLPLTPWSEVDDIELTSVALAKGRLTLQDKTPEAPLESLSVVLAGGVRLAFDDHSGEVSTRGLRRRTVTIEKLSLDAVEGTLRVPQGIYRLNEARLEATGGRLALDGQFLDWTAMQNLFQAAGALRLTLQGKGWTHENWDIQSLSMGLVGQGHRFAIEDLEVRLADTALSGAGEVTLTGETPSWQLSLASERIALARLLALFNMDLRGDGSLEGQLVLGGTGFALDRVELASAVADLAELRIDSDWGPLTLGKASLKATALPLLMDGLGPGDLLRTHLERLIGAAPWRLTGRGTAASMGAVRLSDYDLSLENRQGRLNLALAKGRLSVAMPASK
jgi:hypothetical protein